MKRGVYFLANDQTFELAVTFLNSLRHYNPDVEVTMIPFDSATRRTEALAGRYNFKVFRNPSFLAQCDEWSRHFHSTTKGQYRKLAAWVGEYDEFIYIDIDTVLLHSLDFVWKYLRDFEFVAGHSNIPGSKQFVWNNTVQPDDELSSEQLDFAASTGFIASKQSALDIERLHHSIMKSLKWRSSMELMCAEQPLLNYLIVTSRRRYTSLHSISMLDPEHPLPCECWAGDPNWEVTTDAMPKYQNKPTPVLFVHWAGEWQALGWELKLRRAVRFLGIRSVSLIRRNMKKAHLWRHFSRAPRPSTAYFSGEAEQRTLSTSVP